MKIKVADDGALVIPREVAEAAGMAPGMEIEVAADERCIRAEPAYMEVRLEREGPFLFPVASKPGAALTEAMVEATKAEILEERLQLIIGDE